MSEVQKISMGFTPKSSLKPGQVLEMHFSDGRVQRYRCTAIILGNEWPEQSTPKAEAVDRVAIDPWADNVRNLR